MLGTTFCFSVNSQCQTEMTTLEFYRSMGRAFYGNVVNWSVLDFSYDVAHMISVGGMLRAFAADYDYATGKNDASTELKNSLHAIDCGMCSGGVIYAAFMNWKWHPFISASIALLCGITVAIAGYSLNKTHDIFQNLYVRYISRITCVAGAWRFFFSPLDSLPEQNCQQLFYITGGDAFKKILATRLGICCALSDTWLTYDLMAGAFCMTCFCQNILHYYPSPVGRTFFCFVASAITAAICKLLRLF